MASGRKTAVALRQIFYQDLGVLREPLTAAGYDVLYLDAFAEDPRRLDPLAPDIVVVLGGPFGVDDGERRPFIDAEIAVLRARLRARRPTFGICLGAQLMARALDAVVRPSGRKEIGWKPVTLEAAGASSPLAGLADLPVLHWHGDAFDLPDGAVRLASTDLCRTQAFALGGEIFAAQFHLEVDPRLGMDAWISGHAAELKAEGIDPARLAEEARVAAQTDRCKVPAMFASWLAQLG